MIDGARDHFFADPVEVDVSSDCLRWRIWIRGDQAMAWADCECPGVFSVAEASRFCGEANRTRLARLGSWRLPDLHELQDLYSAQGAVRRLFHSSPIGDFLWKHLDSASYDQRILWSGCHVKDALGGTWCLNFNNGTAVVESRKRKIGFCLVHGRV